MQTMLAFLVASVEEVAQLMPMMLASFAGTCQTKVHLMQVIGHASLLWGETCGGRERGGGGSTCQATVHLMQMMLGTCTRRSPAATDGQTRSSPADADNAALVEENAQLMPLMLASLGGGGRLPNECAPDADDARAVLEEAAQLMPMMLACLGGGTWQARVYLMQMMLGQSYKQQPC